MADDFVTRAPRSRRPRGEIIERGSNFQVRVYLGRGEDGKRRYHFKTFAARKDAERYLTRTMRERDTGAFAEPSRQPLKKYLVHWLAAAVRPRTSVRTHHDYGALLDRYVHPTPLAAKPLCNVTPVDIQKLYSDMLARGLAPRTVQYLHAVLHSAFKQAVHWNLLMFNPTERVKAPVVKRKEMQAFTPEEATAFLEVLHGHEWSALYTLLLTTGLRPGEALALRWSDLDGDVLRVQRTLVYRAGIGIRYEPPKTKRSRRAVPLPALAVRALGTHRKVQAECKLAAGPDYGDEGLIFATSAGRPIDPSRVSRRIREAA